MNMSKWMTLKSLSYASWFILVTWLMTKIHETGLDTNTQGSRCDYHTWQEGQYYQWLVDGYPCTYTAAFLFGYVFYFTLYLLFDYVRRRIMGFNPAIRLRMAEVVIWCMLYWLYLLFFTATELGTISLTMFSTSFLGTLLFMFPLFLIAAGTHYIKQRSELGILSFMVLLYTVLWLLVQ